MKSQLTHVMSLKITDVEGLDAVYVYFAPTGAKEGRLTIATGDQAWSTSWGAMSTQLLGFVMECGPMYLAAKLKMPNSGYHIKIVEAVQQALQDHQAQAGE